MAIIRSEEKSSLQKRTAMPSGQCSLMATSMVARAVLAHSPALAKHDGYTAHPLLTQFAHRNSGHCHKQTHLQIAELLIPNKIRLFRDAILRDECQKVQDLLDSDPDLIHSEFTAGRGIAQAIHHWNSTAVGQLLLNAGANIEALTTLGESPISIQLRFGSINGVRFLLEHGANPNNGARGHMPTDSMVELIALLLDHGWDINNGQLLHDANHGHGNRVQTWLEFGADPNSCNENGQSTLHLIAASGVGRDAIRTLVAAGADINARDNDGQTPLDLARGASRQIAMNELVELGAEDNA